MITGGDVMMIGGDVITTGATTGAEICGGTGVHVLGGAMKGSVIGGVPAVGIPPRSGKGKGVSVAVHVGSDVQSSRGGSGVGV